MKVKTYQSKSLQEALDDVKRDLGGEALILSTRPINARPRFGLFKKETWEITAALAERENGGAVNRNSDVGFRNPDFGNAKASASNLKSGIPDPNSVVRLSASPAAAPARAPIAKDPRMEELIGDISELKKSLRSLTKAIPAKSGDSGGGLFSELAVNGIDHELSDHLITTASRGAPSPSELRERVRRLLADQVVIAPPVELHARSRIISAFVGPTGVGKTTTIAKIAGHAAVRMKKRVAMISTDLFRVGGHDQLKRFGELLGIPAYGCAEVTALKDLVESLDDRDLVLIDTAGSSPSDLARLSKLENVTGSANAKVHLVVSATTRSEDIAKIVTRFQRFNPHSVIFTKIDETDFRGALVGDLLRNELAVSYLTNGQRVPEDLLIPGAGDLARQVLPLEPAL